MKKTLFALVGLAVFAMPLTAAAVTVDPGLGTTLTLGTADLKGTVVSIIQWALGLLGLIAVVMVLYGGFTWMTAGGNEEKISKAKKIISAAVIGLIIVLLAWAIIIFVVDTARDVTT
ncbi:MAG: hypothetical protein Q8P20_03635 [bacterium]|nr:hypothetical protein [bacterium]